MENDHSESAKSSDEGNLGFVTHWQRVGPMLDRIRREELRQFDTFREHHVVDALLQIGFEQSVERTTSGLVELQRIFQQARQ